MDVENNKCGHDGCGCMVSNEEDYCSSYCESAGEGDVTDLKCDCGHSNCS